MNTKRTIYKTVGSVFVLCSLAITFFAIVPPQKIEASAPDLFTTLQKIFGVEATTKAWVSVYGNISPNSQTAQVPMLDDSQEVSVGGWPRMLSWGSVNTSDFIEVLQKAIQSNYGFYDVQYDFNTDGKIDMQDAEQPFEYLLNKTNATGSTITIKAPAPSVDASKVIQDAIDKAVAGDTIVFSSGVYYVSSPIKFKSGLTYLGAVNPTTNSVTTRIVASTTNKFLSLRHKGLDNLTFKNLRFEFFSLTFEDSEYLRFDNTVFVDGTDTTLKLPADTNHLAFIGKSKHVSVINSIFWRRTVDQAGRGVFAVMTENMLVKNNKFSGYFKTAINVAGYRAQTATYPEQRARNVVISNNVMYRTPGLYDEDHAMYVWGMDGVFIWKNIVSGWSFSASGYSLKLRNGLNATVVSNTFKNSGILTYVYSGKSTELIQYLENTMIADNLIDQTKTYPSQYPAYAARQAISYWWTLTTPAPTEGTPAPYEKNVKILRNTIKNGSLVISAARNPSEFTVTDNIGAFKYQLQSGVISNNNI